MVPNERRHRTRTSGREIGPRRVVEPTGRSTAATASGRRTGDTDHLGLPGMRSSQMSAPEPPGMGEPPREAAASEATIASDARADADLDPNPAPTASEPVFAWTPDLASGRVANGAVT